MDDDFSGRFLVVDDEATGRRILETLLIGHGHRCESVADAAGLWQRLQRFSFDGVFLDYCLGDDDGLHLLPQILGRHPHVRVFVVTAHGSIDLAVQAMQRGASGFLTKPYDAARVASEIARVFAHHSTSPSDSMGLIGDSASMGCLRDQIVKMKDVDSTVLIVGESGTGKELVARALHWESTRAAGRFEAVNCAAIPGELLEAELFGYRKGAFTDAKRDSPGLFRICGDGTLFLDEVGEMPLALQSKLLRVLESREVMPLGSSQSVPISARIVAATNQELRKMVADGCFRQDLFYRLSVLQIQVPPLRARREDIPALAQHLVERIAHRLGRETPRLSDDLLARLSTQPWPGNVRELQNALERGVVMAHDGRIDPHDVFAGIQVDGSASGTTTASDSGAWRPLSDARDAFEREYLDELLRATRGNVSRAAELAGHGRTDMYRLFQKHALDPSDYKTPDPPL